MKFLEMFKKALAAALAAAVILLSPGLGAYEACAQVATKAVEGQASVQALPTGSVSGVSSLPNSSSALKLAPASLARLPLSQPAVLKAAPVSAAAASASVLPHAAPINFSLPTASEEGEGAAQAAKPLASLQAAQKDLSQTFSQTREVSGEQASVAAALPFEGRSRASDDQGSVVPTSPLSGWFAPTGLSRSEVAGAGVAAAGVAAVGLRHYAPVAAQPHFWTKVLDFSGISGYYLGNILAFIFAVPQILKTFQEGKDRSPAGRAMLGVAANLALGLISAPLAGQFFWGLQNIFGAVTLAAPIVIGRIWGKPLSKKAAWAATVATCAVLMGLSVGLYAAAAAWLPALLSALIGQAGISTLKLAIQVATGAAFLFLFAPDMAAIWKKQAPKGFTSLLSFLFAVASFGFITWTVQKAIEAPAGSSERLQFLIYAVQNAVYTLVSGLSWYFSRGHERKN